MSGRRPAGDAPDEAPLVCPACREFLEAKTEACPRDGATPAPLPGSTERMRYPHIGHLLAGRYRLLTGLGSGGYGRVYLAVQESLRKLVAVKLLRPEYADVQEHSDPEPGSRVRAGFVEEACKATLLESPHIVRVLDSGDEEGVPWLVMEYVAGSTLGELLRDRGPLSLDDAARIVRPVCLALEELHGKQLVHRDLRPDNVILAPDDPGVLKLVDLGLVKDLSSDRTATGELAVLGSPSYMAPEQFPSIVHANGELAAEVLGRKVTTRTWAGVDGRTDLYALGVIVYQMLTDRRPFEGTDDGMHLGVLHCYQPPPAPSTRRGDLPAAVDAFVLRCLAKEPGDRPQTAEELWKTLEVVMVGGVAKPAVAAAEPPPAEPAGPRRWARPVAVAAITAALLLAVVVLATSEGTGSAPAGGEEVESTMPEAEPAPEPPPAVTPAPERASAEAPEPAAEAGPSVTPKPEPATEPVSAPATVAKAPPAVAATRRQRVTPKPASAPARPERVRARPAGFVQVQAPPAGLWMQRKEVTVRDYRRFRRSLPAGNRGSPAFPIVGVSWQQAQEYCQWLGKQPGTSGSYSLPTLTQWRTACRAGRSDSRKYPWGNSSPEGKANWTWPERGGAGLARGCSHPKGDGPLCDLAGNVGEWVLLGPSTAGFVGGSYLTQQPEDLGCDAVGKSSRGRDNIGFRCLWRP